MEKGLHYTVDEKQKSILITEDGYEAAEDVLEVSLAAPSASARPSCTLPLREHRLSAWVLLSSPAEQMLTCCGRWSLVSMCSAPLWPA